MGRYFYEAVVYPAGDKMEARIPDFDVVTFGDNLADAAFMAQDALEMKVSSLLSDGVKVEEIGSFGHDLPRRRNPAGHRRARRCGQCRGCDHDRARSRGRARRDAVACLFDDTGRRASCREDRQPAPRERCRRHGAFQQSSKRGTAA